VNYNCRIRALGLPLASKFQYAPTMGRWRIPSFIIFISLVIGLPLFSMPSLASTTVASAPDSHELGNVNSAPGGYTSTFIPAYEADPSIPCCGGGGGSLAPYQQQTYSDHDGTFTAEWYPDNRQIRWTYRISAAVRAIITSPVSEEGLYYEINGKGQPQNAPHNVGSDYLFHGTMSNVSNYSTVEYTDYYSFEVKIDGQVGSASISIYGRLYSY
jgi:hypothetical protein